MINTKIYRNVLLGFFVLGLLMLFPAPEAVAQCPMCRIGAETNLASGGTAGAGLNKGILLLLSLPYLLVGTFGYIWWKNKKSDPVEE